MLPMGTKRTTGREMPAGRPERAHAPHTPGAAATG
jgi:hypothetical protein